jgi:hypothetical protein
LAEFFRIFPVPLASPIHVRGSRLHMTAHTTIQPLRTARFRYDAE